MICTPPIVSPVQRVYGVLNSSVSSPGADVLGCVPMNTILSWK